MVNDHASMMADHLLCRIPSYKDRATTATGWVHQVTLPSSAPHRPNTLGVTDMNGIAAPAPASTTYGNFTVPRVVDETLREGVERCMFPVEPDMLMMLFNRMVDAGIREFVVGSGPEEPDVYERICIARDEGRVPADVQPIFLVLLNCWDATYSTFKRMRRDWTENTTFSFGMIPHHRAERLFERVVLQFKDLGARHLRVSILNNFTRQVDEKQYSDIRWQIDWAYSLGIRNIRVNDSVGKLYPETTEALCKRLLADYPDVIFCLHCHNDRGLALANQLISIYSGFQMVEGSLCGFGNRSGIAPLEILAAICRDKNIRIGKNPVDVTLLCQAAQFAEQVFMQVPNVFRPVSGKFVTKANFGVLNIPDFLAAEGERDYFLNIANLHPATIRKALDGHDFAEELLQDQGFLSRISTRLRKLIETRYEQQTRDYGRILSELIGFYSSSQLSQADLIDLATCVASEYSASGASVA
jgi:2-isopropylmalate synthase